VARDTVGVPGMREREGEARFPAEGLARGLDQNPAAKVAVALSLWMEIAPPWTRRDRFATGPHPCAGRIAQLVEQLTLNQRVPGSSPGAPTKQINGLDLMV
jgi:hypothetical protein